MKRILTTVICMLFANGSALADQTGDDHSALLLSRQTEQSGPRPSNGWFVAKITNQAQFHGPFNFGMALHFYLRSGMQTEGRRTNGAAMGRDRALAIAGTPYITQLGLSAQGTYLSEYSGVVRLDFVNASGEDVGRDITLGGLVNGTLHESFTVGNAPFLIDNQQSATSVVVTRRFPYIDQSERHLFAEQGIAVFHPRELGTEYYPRELGAEYSSLDALKILSDRAGKLRVLVHGDRGKEAEHDNRLWLIGLTENGLLDTEFGEGGMLELSARVGAANQVFVHKPEYAGAEKAPSIVYFATLSHQDFPTLVSVDAVNVFTGERPADFSPFTVRSDYGRPSRLHLDTNGSHIVMVGAILGDGRRAKAQHFVAVNRKNGDPETRVSGDSRFRVDPIGADLQLEEIAFAEDLSLYLVERGALSDNESFLAITRHDLESPNPQRRDPGWGIDGSLQINASVARSNYNERLSSYKMGFSASVAFIEPQANGHLLVIVGASQVR